MQLPQTMDDSTGLDLSQTDRGRFGRGVLAPFTAFLITPEVFATSRVPIWEPTMTTRTDDVM
ncbi:hypothetical protein AQJ46_50645 [Streptomyces canus]|uniref:Uncharacterized protein n=1 Tax=Streptomyces canus TaxID=58343 RepID=A0A101RJT7_9ACTN|nr:hypothetical protein AQJ46_50645 [Streptomyces canus]